MWTFISLILILLGGFVIWLWPSKLDEENPFETVYTTGDPGEIALIKSLLNEEEIPFLIKGEGVQDLFGIGRLGAGYNIITGPAQVQVPSSYTEETHELLKAMRSEPKHF